MNSKGILKFHWLKVTLLFGGGLHYGQESFGGELCTWMKKMTWLPTWRHFFKGGGGVFGSSFLGNLKASNKKLGLRRTPTWIKYFFSLRDIFALFFALFSMTLLGSTKTGYIIEVSSSN